MTNGMVKAVLGANYLISNELYQNPIKQVQEWMFYNAQVYPQWFNFWIYTMLQEIRIIIMRLAMVHILQLQDNALTLL